MQRNRIIGIALIAGSLGLFTAAMINIGHKPEAKPQAKVVRISDTIAPAQAPTAPAQGTVAAAGAWQHFQCRRGNETLSDFKQARAEFMGRRNNRVYWRVFTPTNNSPETAHNFNVNPSRIVCSYVKA